MKAIILAGGSGKRLWPLSSATFPKQFLDFGMGGSLLKQTVGRFPEEETLIVTSEKYVKPTFEQLGSSYKGEVLVEPTPKNTAPAICLSLKHLIERLGAKREDVCVVCPSDHYFKNEEDFRSLLPIAEKAALSGLIVTFGITPSHPETGYGYIQAGEGKGILPVSRFIEKPNAKRAEELLLEGNYFWNAGIFVFQISHFLYQLEKHVPLLAEWFLKPYDEAIETFPHLPSISIDHALMEKTSSLALIPYPSNWSDLGTWDRLLPMLPRDEKGNFSNKAAQAVDSSGCTIFGSGVKAVGVKDLLIVKIGEQVVVCSKEQVHRLSELQSSSLVEQTDSC